MGKLYIDSSNNLEIIIKLEIEGKTFIRKHVGQQRSSQMVLPLIDEILKEHGIKVQEITKIFVNPGPGSFTGLRVGVAIANTLGFLLGISVNDKPVGQMVEPVYS